MHTSRLQAMEKHIASLQSTIEALLVAQSRPSALSGQYDEGPASIDLSGDIQTIIQLGMWAGAHPLTLSVFLLAPTPSIPTVRILQHMSLITLCKPGRPSLGPATSPLCSKQTQDIRTLLDFRSSRKSECKTIVLRIKKTLCKPGLTAPLSKTCYPTPQLPTSVVSILFLPLPLRRVCSLFDHERWRAARFGQM